MCFHCSYNKTLQCWVVVQICSHDSTLTRKMVINVLCFLNVVWRRQKTCDPVKRDWSWSLLTMLFFVEQIHSPVVWVSCREIIQPTEYCLRRFNIACSC